MIRKIKDLLLYTHKLFSSHPLTKHDQLAAWGRFAKWQLASRLAPFPVLYPFTERCTLVVDRGMTGATGNLYCGLHEFEEMGFLLHFLRPGDLFADVGANIGSYTILASGHTGAESVAFEPIPTTFRYLERNVRCNGLDSKVRLRNMGVGSQAGELAFTTHLDTENRVATEKDAHIVKVPVISLDEAFPHQSPTMIKIDVEGFETEVIKGALRTLRAEALQVVLIELFGDDNRYGLEGNFPLQQLNEAGFHPYRYDPLSRTLTPRSRQQGANAIFIRDIEFVSQRLQSADRVAILHKEF